MDAAGVRSEGEWVRVKVIQSTDGYGEVSVSARLADAMVACFEADPGCVVRRVWDRVSYSVSVTYAGEVWPFAAWAVGHDDVTWREIEGE